MNKPVYIGYPGYIIGLMKNQLGGKIMITTIDDSNKDKKEQDTKKCISKKLENYKNCLEATHK